MNYHILNESDIEVLRGICSEQRVHIKEDIHEDFSHDELSGTYHSPEAVIDILKAEEVSEIMIYANTQRIPVTPRGQGTGLVGGAVPICGGIVLNMSKMDRILELDEQNLTLTVEPGVLLMDIASYTNESGFLYPPDPGEKSATIGGNISTNAGGMRAVKYGVTKDYVRSLEVVLPDGQMITIGSKTVKNSSGYNLKDLIIGSEGTLAIVTKAILKLLPKPHSVLSLLIPYPSLQAAAKTVPLLLQSQTDPTAIEYMEQKVLECAQEYLGKAFPHTGAPAYLMLTFDGSQEDEVKKRYEQAAEICIGQGALDVFISDTEERQESIWSARGAFLEAIKASTTLMDECDVVVPRSQILTFIEFTKAVEKKLDLRILSFGHAGDGNLHVYLLKDDLSEQEFESRLDRAFTLLYDKGKELQGLVSGEHGIGYAKQRYLSESAGPVALTLMQSIKKSFDPNLILNPQKVVGEIIQ